jgi:MFS family permease
VLRQRNFSLYWSGQFISLTGGWMQQLALSWVVLGLVPTAFALGLVNFVASAPAALLMLHGGVAADRFDKRRILLVTQVVFMMGAFIMAALVGMDILRLWHVLVLAGAAGSRVGVRPARVAGPRAGAG